MSIMFRDTRDNIEKKLAQKTLDYLTWWEIIYADDSMCLGKRARELNIFRAEIEKESGEHKLELNYKKCNYEAMNGKTHIHL